MDLRVLLGVLLSFVSLVTSCGGSSSGGDGRRGKATFKETSSICETTDGVRSFAGYVRIPAGAPYAPYEQNIFFWFFEARREPERAPLTVWLQGGPGMGSMDQALGGNGPCRVLDDSETTEVNEWSWTSHSNMLYIDQPVQAGFSYDTPTPGQVDAYHGALNDGNDSAIFMDGVFGSGDMSKTATTTAQAAEAIWDFMQVWMADKTFSDYRRDSISIWTQSYGGHWAPGIATHFLSKTPSAPERPIGISHLGIFNGISDFLVQGGEHYPNFARNNTYGIEVYTQDVADEITEALEKPGGCRDQAVMCQEMATALDPENTGGVPEVQGACGLGTDSCLQDVYMPVFFNSGVNEFDIAQGRDIQFPAPYAHGFLNRESVQEKLGVDIAGGKGVNYTVHNQGFTPVYAASGDYLRGDFRPQLGALLDQGVPVTLAYGDRDFTANWFGGEALSLKIPFDGRDDFADAGYADFVVDGEVAGKTRQAGLLSFTRVFQSGHEVPFYKPKETHELFVRALQKKDIPTGAADAASFVSDGPSSVRDVRAAPAGNAGESFCYIMNAPLDRGQCSEAQLAALKGGKAVLEDFVLVG